MCLKNVNIINLNKGKLEKKNIGATTFLNLLDKEQHDEEDADAVVDNLLIHAASTIREHKVKQK